MTSTLLSRADVRIQQSQRLGGGGTVFEYPIDVFLKDASPFGTVYFARFFEWQGMCREAFWARCVMPTSPPSTLQLITKSATMEFVRAARPFEGVVAALSVLAVKRVSTMIYISFYDRMTHHLLADGFQTIVFADSSRAPLVIPDPILDVLTAYRL